VSVIEHYGGIIGRNKVTFQDELDAAGIKLPASAGEKQRSTARAKDKFLHVVFISSMDKTR
jgi:hypothetical protein